MNMSINTTYTTLQGIEMCFPPNNITLDRKASQMHEQAPSSGKKNYSR